MQSRTPDQGVGVFGGMKRFLPPVDAPYGMPLNSLILPLAIPCTFPEVVSTVQKMPPGAPPPPRMRAGGALAAGACASAGLAAAAAPTAVAAIDAAWIMSRRLTPASLPFAIASS